MKRLFLLSTLMLMHKMNANALSDAIRTSNVEKVKTILAQNLPQKNFVKYLDTAEQTVRLRRDALMVQQVNPCHYDNAMVHRKKKNLLLMSSALFFAGAFYPASKENGLMVIASLISSFAAVCMAAHYNSKDLGNSTAYVYRFYQDAVIIKELLYDHLSILE